MPRRIETLVKETYNWFSHSTLRQIKYANLYSNINVGEEPLKILKVADTRWLSIAPCIDRILKQYDVLKKHFEEAKRIEGCYMAEILYEMYLQPQFKLYLLFLKDILSQVY